MQYVNEVEMVDAIIDRLAGSGRALSRADVELVLDLEVEYLASRGIVTTPQSDSTA